LAPKDLGAPREVPEGHKNRASGAHP